MAHHAPNAEGVGTVLAISGSLSIVLEISAIENAS
jgi:hypothetical protein